MAKKETINNKVGETLNTDGIIKAMAEKSKGTEVVMSQKECAAALGYFKEVIQEALATGAKIQITGFMTIQPSYRAARKGNNVITNEAMNIPESVVANIKAGKNLKDVMKNLDKAVVAAVKKAAEK